MKCAFRHGMVDPNVELPSWRLPVSLGRPSPARLLTLPCLLVVATLLTACTPANLPAGTQGSATVPAGSGAGAVESTIIVALSQAPSSMDPGDHRERQSETVIRNMFDGLVTRDARSGVHLELAQRIDWLDEETLEVELRKDVLFHDGIEMTADDVIFTFERIIADNGIEYPEPHTSVRKGLVAPLVSIEKVSEYTVVMHFSGPWPPALQMLVHQQIVPKHYVEDVGMRGFLEHPIGTGPFRFARAAPDLTEIEMVRFDDYYGGAPQLPPLGAACIDRVVFRVIPDALTRAAALRAGEVHIIQSVPLDLVDLLSQEPGVAILSAPGTRPTWMDLNVDRAPFDDVLVRQALNYAVDKWTIADEVYAGQALPLRGPLSPYNNFVHEGLQAYGHDPKRALSMLAEAGWTDSDRDGVLDKDRRKFAITLDTLEVWGPLAEAVAEDLRSVGIEVTVRYWELATIRPLLLAGERMAYIDGWGDSAFDPVGHFEAKWHTYVEGELYGQVNYSGFSNERVDELIRMGELTAEVDERHKIYDEAQEIIYQEAPAVFLLLPREIAAVSVRVQNWRPASDGRINLHDVCLAP